MPVAGLAGKVAVTTAELVSTACRDPEVALKSAVCIAKSFSATVVGLPVKSPYAPLNVEFA